MGEGFFGGGFFGGGFFGEGFFGGGFLEVGFLEEGCLVEGEGERCLDAAAEEDFLEEEEGFLEVVVVAVSYTHLTLPTN